MIAKTSDSKGAYTARHAERDIKRAVMIGSGVSLINAEKAAKIYYSPKAVQDAEEIMNAYAVPTTTDEEEPEWYELPEDAPMPSAALVGIQDPSRLSRRNSFVVLERNPNPLSTPPVDSIVLEELPQDTSPVELELPTYPVSFSFSPLEPPRPLAVGQPTTTASRLSSLPAHLVSSVSSALHDVSVSVGLRNSTTNRDSQKRSSWSLSGHGVVMGAVSENGKK
jgi:hypothetical protein